MWRACWWSTRGSGTWSCWWRATTGSASSTSQALLNALQPETAILSVGRDNAYGHPAPETLERLERAGAEIYRTDRDGTVTVRTR